MKFGMQEFFLTYIRGKGFVARDIVRKTWLHRQDEINRLTERNAELEGLNKKLRGENRIKGEFMRTRQCPDHSGKWERGRCLQCEIEELQAECERLTKWNQQMVEKAASGGTLDGYRELAQKLNNADQRADQLQAKLDAVMVMFVYKEGDRYYTGIIGDTDVTDDLQQALNAPETA